MSQDDSQKTRIVLLFGMFKFLRLPFYLRNVLNIFQMMMDQILGDLPFCFVYVYDILIFSPDLDTHVHHLPKFWSCSTFMVSPWATPSVYLPVLNSSSQDIISQVLAVSAISSFTPLSDKPALQRFLGMLNFYRKFIKNAALILAPLTNALKGPGKRLDWTPPLDAAFHHA